MSTLNFTRKELDQILKACAHIEIDDCTPPYLQDFIATMLAEMRPALSAKVRQLSPDQMDDLCEHIKQNPSPVP